MLATFGGVAEHPVIKKSKSEGVTNLITEIIFLLQQHHSFHLRFQGLLPSGFQRQFLLEFYSIQLIFLRQQLIEDGYHEII